jgi:hypothetical protein
MSVLRAAAPTEEIRHILEQRISKPGRWLHGIAVISCDDVRKLVARRDTEQRVAGDRLFYVLDTDMMGLPHHADVFATMPRRHARNTPKAAWKAERERMMDLVTAGLSRPAQFRNGVLAAYETPRPG